MHAYIYKKIYVFIFNIFVYNIKYMNIDVNIFYIYIYTLYECVFIYT